MEKGEEEDVRGIVGSRSEGGVEINTKVATNKGRGREGGKQGKEG